MPLLWHWHPPPSVWEFRDPQLLRTVENGLCLLISLDDHIWKVMSLYKTEMPDPLSPPPLQKNRENATKIKRAFQWWDNSMNRQKLGTRIVLLSGSSVAVRLLCLFFGLNFSYKKSWSEKDWKNVAKTRIYLIKRLFAVAPMISHGKDHHFVNSAAIWMGACFYRFNNNCSLNFKAS